MAAERRVGERGGLVASAGASGVASAVAVPAAAPVSAAIPAVTVVGAGLAGLSATLALAEAGATVTLVSLHPSERAQSVMAEGGINAALDVMGEHDSPAEHAADTLASAAGLASEAAVRGLAADAPGIIDDLVALGVPFNREGGRLVQRYFGGQKKARTTYAMSSTGKALVGALVDAVRRHEAAGRVARLAHHELVDLRVDEAETNSCAREADDLVASGREGRACAGVVVRDAWTGALVSLSAPVIFATGGYGGLFGDVTTGSTTNVGDATALALERGVELANLEFVQYHPTTIAIPDKRLLVSEAARGEGGRLLTLRDGEPWYFMEERYPELGNLMPRDVVSREEAAVLADPACDGVWLDLRGLPRAVWRERLADLRDEIIHYAGVDPARELVSVAPGIHYCMGGILVDVGHRTSLRGLYAAGECACAYHGANRLGGNSLLGAVRSGRVAAASVLADAAPRGEAVAGAPATGDDATVLPDAARGGWRADDRDVTGTTEVIPADNATNAETQRILREALGILRDGARLRDALGELDALLARDVSARQRRRLLLSRAAVAGALAREESRGAHFRTDFPHARPELARLTVARVVDGESRVEWRAAEEGVRPWA